MLLQRVNSKIEELKLQPRSDDYSRTSMQSLLVRKRVLEAYLKKVQDDNSPLIRPENWTWKEEPNKKNILLLLNAVEIELNEIINLNKSNNGQISSLKLKRIRFSLLKFLEMYKDE